MALNIVEILITSKNLTQKGFAEAEASSTAAGAKLSKVGALAGAVTAVGLYEATKAAIDFNSKMETLVTQAGVSQSQLGTLKSGVLDLAGKVGFSPDSLAESLYHVASNMQSMGATSQQMLAVVKVAAEGAQVGHANLVDVTNALTSAVASGIPGVKNYSQAMGALNAIVGTGDMTMQNLSEALGTGLLPVMKGYGLSLKDVGAGLATMGDLNIRGSEAATKLRMAVQAMSVPAAAGKAHFQQMGMSVTQLSEDMRHGGLLTALQDLQKHYTAAGITGTAVGQQLTNDFGKKAGVGLAVLMGNMDRLQSKYPDLAKGSSNFGKAWSDTQKQLATQLKQLAGQMEGLAITIGQKLVPVVQAVVGWMIKHKTAVEVMIAVIGALTGALLVYLAVTKTIKIAQLLWADATKVVAAAQWLLNFAMDANPIGLLIIAIAAIVAGLIYAYTHFKKFRQVINEVFDWIKGHWPLLLAILTGPIGLAVLLIVKHWRQIVDGVRQMWDDVIGFFKRLPRDIYNAIAGLDKMLYNVGKNAILGLWHGAESIFKGLLHTAASWGHDLANAIGSVFGIHFSEPSEATQMVKAGKQIPAGLRKGILAGRGQLANALGGLPLGGAGSLAGGGALQVQLSWAGGGGTPLQRALQQEIRLIVLNSGGGGKNSVQKSFGQVY